MFEVPITTELPGCKPQRQHDDDAAFDLVANITQPVIINPGYTEVIPTGVKLGLTHPEYALVLSRSGLAAKFSISVLNAPGLIDSGYRGEVKVILHNSGLAPYKVQAGDRIAQLMILRQAPVILNVTTSLDETTRGEGGLGSTGISKLDEVFQESPKTQYPIAKFMKEELVMDPDTKEPVTVAFFKDESSGGIFAIDSSFIEQLDEPPIVIEPFNGQEVILKGV